MPLKTIIIDDEPFVRHDLGHLLMSCREVELRSEAGSLAEAKAELAAFAYDLVFLDVRMPGGSGFDLLPFVPPKAKVVFVTGHDEYAVKAFEVNALDYLVKPVSRERLTNTLARIVPGAGPAEKIRVKTDAGHYYLDPENIVSIISLGGNYIQVALDDQAPILCRKTLKVWEKELPEDGFIRVHRATIVNTRFIRSVSRKRDGGFEVTLADSRTLAVSRRMAGRLRQWLKGWDRGL